VKIKIFGFTFQITIEEEMIQKGNQAYLKGEHLTAVMLVWPKLTNSISYFNLHFMLVVENIA